jgi:serine/threonine protein kinase
MLIATCDVESGTVMNEPDKPEKAEDPVSGEGATLDHDPSLISQLPPTPKFIGVYRLIRPLGEGGMGQVWLAEQTAPVKREVALKLIRGGMFSSALLQRFEAERQSLAIMDHPTIAKVFDAGSTVDGQPYFVMEYVPGLHITRYCDEKKLSMKERLELFTRVCDGVQHAHQKAIIHRDLKPSNILVVEIDGKPMPRIIDFGIAKVATEVESQAERTFITKLGALVGTPGYMSPEQADPSVRDVDTRTDVYSLGVVLYELLTGILPFEPAVWQQHFDLALKQLREVDPLSPSHRLRKDASTMTASAERRGMEPTTLVSQLCGDLDWITMKALARERERRYGSPSEFAKDVRRYLQNEPVEARPPSTSYKVGKYVQRHRLAVGFAAVVVGLLIAFGVTEYFQVRKITRERDRADRVARFMVDMFKNADPNEARGNSVTAREVLDKASANIESGLSNDPKLQGMLMGDMGHAYANMGQFPQAQAMLEKSVAIGRQTAGLSDPATLNAMGILGFLYIRQGRYADAESVLRESIPANERVHGPNHLLTLAAKRYLAFALENEGKYAEAEQLQQKVLAAARATYGPSHWETLLSANLLANILDDLNQLPEAEQLYRDTWKAQIETLGADHPDSLTTASNLAGTLEKEGKYEEAEKIQRDTLALRMRVLGAEHPDTLAVKLNLANTLAASGRNADAETIYRETLAAQQRVMEAGNPDVLSTMANLANTLRAEGRLTEAEAMQRETLAKRQKVLGAVHPDTVKSAEDLIATLYAAKKTEEAAILTGKLVAAFEQAHDAQGVANTWYDLACAAALAGTTEEAFVNLKQAVDHGFSDGEHMKNDNDLKSLRRDPRFEALVTEARGKAKSTAKP